MLAIITPIGLFLGRIANFINSELIGTPTNLPWSVVFIKIDNIPRHPSQIYEAFLEGLLLFLIINIIFKYNNKNISGNFLDISNNGQAILEVESTEQLVNYDGEIKFS